MKPASQITSTGFWQRWTLFATALRVSATQLMRTLLSLRYASGAYVIRSGFGMTSLDPERLVRAISIACASLCWKGKIEDTEGILGLSDEFLQYITGDDSSAIPRPDKATKGRMPKP